MKIYVDLEISSGVGEKRRKITGTLEIPEKELEALKGFWWKASMIRPYPTTGGHAKDSTTSDDKTVKTINMVNVRDLE